MSDRVERNRRVWHDLMKQREEDCAEAATFIVDVKELVSDKCFVDNLEDILFCAFYSRYTPGEFVKQQFATQERTR